MEKEIHFAPQDIVNKKFKADAKGYSALEVDSYLDLVVEDYLNFAKEIDRLSRENESLKAEASKNRQNNSAALANSALVEEKRRLEIENASMRSQLEGIKPGDNVTSDNMGYIRKIRQYEKFLHDEGYNVNDLKSKKQ